MTREVVFRADYQPYPFSVPNVFLTFDICNDATLVTNIMHFKRELPGDLVLRGEQSSLASFELNNTSLSNLKFKFADEDTLIIKECPAEFTIKVVTKINPNENTALNGLYKSNDVLCGICDITGFRRISYHPDRPDVLSIYETTIIAEHNYPVLLSDGKLTESGVNQDGKHWVKWQDQTPKTSSMFTLIAGDLSCVKTNYVTKSGKDVTLSMFVDKGNEDKCDYALNSLKEVMRYGEEQFDSEYKNDEYKLVAIEKLNAQSQEYRTTAILSSDIILTSNLSKDEHFQDIQKVIAQTYLSPWMRNGFSIRDWFQIALPSGLARFQQQKFTQSYNPANRLKDIKNIFDTLSVNCSGVVRGESVYNEDFTYSFAVVEKSAAIIKMLETVLTKEEFCNRLNTFLANNHEKAYVIEDFLNAMLTENHNVNLNKFLQWYDVPENPKVKVTSNFENSVLSLKITQVHNANFPFYIPIKIKLFCSSGVVLHEGLIELQENEATYDFEFKNLQEKPIISLLRDFSAPIILEDDLSKNERAKLLEFETDPYQKWMNLYKLTLSEIVSFYPIPENERYLSRRISEDLVEAYRKILLDESLDKGVLAELLSIPSVFAVVNALKQTGYKINIVEVEKVRKHFAEELGFGLYFELEKVYQRLAVDEDHNLNAVSFANRELRKQVLNLMMRGNPVKAITKCFYLYFDNNATMTEKLHSLYLYNLFGIDEARELLFNHFYERFHDNPKLIDELFAIQALSQDQYALNRIKELTEHPEFDWGNSNRVRSLIYNFAYENLLMLHKEDGSGYEFLVDMLLKIDSVNPNLASELSLCVVFVDYLDLKRARMLNQIISNTMEEKISDDLKSTLNTLYWHIDKKITILDDSFSYNRFGFITSSVASETDTETETETELDEDNEWESLVSSKCTIL